MNNTDDKNDLNQEKIDKNVQRTVANNALRKIGVIVAEEQRADDFKAKMQRWFLRFGGIVLLACLLLLAKAMSLI